MEILDLKNKYDALVKNYTLSEQLDFIKHLLSTNEKEVLDYHYSLIAKKDSRELHISVRVAFEERGNTGLKYLLEKVEVETNEALIAELIQILGKICYKRKTKEALPYAKKFLKHNNPDIRYRSSIVIGWVGEKEDLAVLEDIFYSDTAPFIRDMTASAMRQIWLRFREIKNYLLSIYIKGLKFEEDEKVILCIIGCLQTLMEKNFGVKEDRASGFIYRKDIQELKNKILANLEVI